MLWGIAIADTSVPGYEHAQVEIAHTQLTCRVDGKNVTLKNDRAAVRGGLYSRHPWFATDAHDPLPLAYSNASPRAGLPPGHLEGCTVTARVRISRGALLQMGMDYWRNPTIGYGKGGNNHEAGASNWYFSSKNWQEATFTDIHR